MPAVWFFSDSGWYTSYGGISSSLNGAHIGGHSRQGGGLSKLDRFIRFDEVHYWLSRTRDLITNAETFAYPGFRESFRELRREARKSEMELVIALFRFE